MKYYSEHLRKADETYGMYEDSNGRLVHEYSKDGESILFRTLNDLIQYIYFGEDVDRIYVTEEQVEEIFESDNYSFHQLKEKYK